MTFVVDLREGPVAVLKEASRLMDEARRKARDVELAMTVADRLLRRGDADGAKAAVAECTEAAETLELDVTNVTILLERLTGKPAT